MPLRKVLQATMRLYEHILFPAGIQLTQEKNVYIPQISPIYLYKNEKQPPKEADITKMEGPVGLEPTTRSLKGFCSNRLSYGPTMA